MEGEIACQTDAILTKLSHNGADTQNDNDQKIRYHITDSTSHEYQTIPQFIPTAIASVTVSWSP